MTLECFDNGTIPRHAKLMLPYRVRRAIGTAADAHTSQDGFPGIWDVLDMLGRGGEFATVEYQPDYKRQYRIGTYHAVHWTQPARDDPDQNDLWSMYLPPRVRSIALPVCAADTRRARCCGPGSCCRASTSSAAHTPARRRTHRVHIQVRMWRCQQRMNSNGRREGRRSVENELLLIDALVRTVGRHNLHVRPCPHECLAHRPAGVHGGADGAIRAGGAAGHVSARAHRAGQPRRRSHQPAAGTRLPRRHRAPACPARQPMLRVRVAVV